MSKKNAPITREQFDSKMKNLVEKLTKGGVTTIYKSLNDEYDPEMVTLSHKLEKNDRRKCIVLEYNSGDGVNTEIEIINQSPAFRQAVLLVSEKARKVTRTVSTEVWNNSHEEMLKICLVENFPIAFPDDSGVSFEVKVISKEAYTKPKLGRCMVTAEVTAKVKATKSYFLIGYDEEDMFISSLRKPVATVAEAHAQLIPKSLKKLMAAPGKSGILRQGEWFLVPATDKELASSKDKPTYHEDYIYSKYGEDESDHQALLSIRDKQGNTSLITGGLENSRHNLVLNGWYRPVRNNENPSKDGQDWD